EGEKVISRQNYYYGSDRSKWLENVPGYEKVRAANVYSGIDVVYQGNNRRLRYDFEVKPGASPKAIRLAYPGAKKVSVDKAGNLHVATANSESVSTKPYVYQEVNGVRREVQGSYRVDSNQQVTFDIAAYDTTQTLTIDPTLTNSTLLGGNQVDSANGVAVDGTAIYIAGTTLSANFPSTSGAIGLIGTTDAFVTKMNLLLTSPLSYSTFIG